MIFGKAKKMKTERTIKTLVSMSLMIMMLTVMTAKTFAKENMWEEKTRKVELSKEKIDHIMERIADNNPKLARELRELRKEKPELFRKKIRAIIRERYRDNDKENMPRGDRDRKHDGRGKNLRNEERGMRGKDGDHKKRKGPGEHGMSMKKHDGKGMMPGMNKLGGRGVFRERMQKKHDQFIKWLKKNYADAAKKLEAVREKAPEKYLDLVAETRKKFEKIMHAEKKNPELAKVLKEDLKLKGEREKVLKEIRGSSGKERDELIDELKDIVNARFDLIVRRKQLQYEGLRKKLAELEKQVEKRQGEVEKLQDQRTGAIAQRLEELIGKTEKIKWD